MKLLRHPVRSIREPFGIAGVIVACVALIAALGGGAYAASGGLSGKQKKEVEKIAKKYAGKPGATGATGPAGSAGAKGDAGAAGSNGTNGTGTSGTNGTNGTNGKSVVLVNSKPATCPGEEGFSYEIEGSGIENEVCSSTGGGGGGGLPKTLAPEETETGAWATPVFGSEGFVPISFTVPLGADLDASHVVVVNHPNVSVPAECNDGVAPPPSAAHPEAKPGFLCVFEGLFETETDTRLETIQKAASNALGASTAGAVLSILSEQAAENHGAGTWAVTGALAP